MSLFQTHFTSMHARPTIPREIELIATQGNKSTAIAPLCLIEHDWPLVAIRRCTVADMPEIKARIAATHGRLILLTSSALNDTERRRVADCVAAATFIHSFGTTDPFVIAAALRLPRLTCFFLYGCISKCVPDDMLPENTGLTALHVADNVHTDSTTVYVANRIVATSPHISVLSDPANIISTPLPQCTTLASPRTPPELPPSITTLVLPCRFAGDYGTIHDFLKHTRNLTHCITTGPSVYILDVDNDWLGNFVPFAFHPSMRVLSLDRSMVNAVDDDLAARITHAFPHLTTVCIDSIAEHVCADKFIHQVINGAIPDLINLSIGCADVSRATIKLLVTLLASRPNLVALRIGTSRTEGVLYGGRAIEPLANAIANHPRLTTFGFKFAVDDDVFSRTLVPAFSRAPRLTCVETVHHLRTLLDAPFTGLAFAGNEHSSLVCDSAIHVLPMHAAPHLHWHNAGKQFATQQLIATVAVFCLTVIRASPRFSLHVLRDLVDFIVPVHVCPSDVLPPECWSYTSLTTSQLAALA